MSSSLPTSLSPVQYHDYLALDQILEAQNLRSQKIGHPIHDEMLFIISHQTYELWFKQILHELNSVIDIFSGHKVKEENMGLAVGRLNRVVEIIKILIDQIRVLETMTPLDFLDFRHLLYPASGFQSLQFRLVENKLGLNPKQRLSYNQFSYQNYVKPSQSTVLQDSEQSLSLFRCVERWLERTPFLQIGSFDFWNSYRKAVMEMFAQEGESLEENSFSSSGEKKNNLKNIEDSKKLFNSLFDEEEYKKLLNSGHWRLSYKAIHAALFIQLYRDLPALQLPFRLLTSLLDIDELMTAWRSRHALMAKRMIGLKVGTGGSSGYQYLQDAADQHKIFSDFFQLTTFFIPRSALPRLPGEVETKLRFHFEI